MKRGYLKYVFEMILVLLLLVSCGNQKPSDHQGEDHDEDTASSYRISDLLGDPVSIRIVTKDYDTEYDRTFTGEELADLMSHLENAVVMKDIEPVKGAGGIGLDITVTYKDGRTIEAKEGNFCFRLGDTVYPYPLESLDNHKTFLERFLLIEGDLQ